MAKLKPVRHDEQHQPRRSPRRAALADHLLAGRPGVAFALCFWQSNLILEIAAAPLPAADQALIVLAPTEPFMTTVTVCAYAAIILAAPFISYQLFAYVLPAFSPRERKVIVPLLIMRSRSSSSPESSSPTSWSCRRRSTSCSTSTATSSTPSCGPASTTRSSRPRCSAGGVVFQVPVVLLALVRLRIVTIAQLRKNRRYAYLGIAVVAAALPGVDPISMLIEMVPLLLLYELSILLARGLGGTAATESDEPLIQES